MLALQVHCAGEVLCSMRTVLALPVLERWVREKTRQYGRRIVGVMVGEFWRIRHFLRTSGVRHYCNDT